MRLNIFIHQLVSIIFNSELLKNNNIFYLNIITGHKEKWEFKECVCRSCLVVVERQKITAARVAHLRYQRKVATKNALHTNMRYTHPSPLTKEEEFVLSSQLQTKKKTNENSVSGKIFKIFII